MPLVTVKIIENVFTPEQKNQMIEELTDAMVRVEGEAMRNLTFVWIEEIKSGDFAMGGKRLGTADVHAVQKGGMPEPAAEPAPAMVGSA